jgi:hypothetical protein
MNDYRDDQTTTLIAELSPIRDEELAALAETPATALLLTEIAATSKEERRRSGRRRRLALALATGAVAAIAIALTAATGTFSPAPAAAGVRFSTEGRYIVANVTDPSAAAADLRAAFQQKGFDIHIKLIPASPSIVGTVVYVGESPGASEIRSVQGGPCETGGGGCPIGLKIPRDFTGRADIALGRRADAGEEYGSTASAFAPGEELHCSGLLGAPVARAVAVLRDRGISAEWRWREAPGKPSTSPPIAGYVWNSTPISRNRVLLWIGRDHLTQQAAGSSIRDVAGYKARFNVGC